jgi:hypothetical protein
MLPPIMAYESQKVEKKCIHVSTVSTLQSSSLITKIVRYVQHDDPYLPHLLLLLIL